MVTKDYFKGLLFGVGSLILIGIQPIIISSRPSEIDIYTFAMMTVIYEAIIFFPLMLIERKRIKLMNNTNTEIFNEVSSLLNGWKKNKKLLIYLGINFAISQILFYLAYQLTSVINASLAQKTTIIFGILFGYFINHEKISYTQIIFSVLLFFGLALAVTQGSFNLLEFDLGVIVMIITTILWMLAHAITKPALDRNEITSLQLTFIRNCLNGIILLSLYFLFFPLKNISLIFNPINQIYFILMGFAYGFDIFFWYKAIKYTEISTTSIVTSPAPLLTVLLATIILGEIFTIFHLVGALIIIISIIFIVKKNIIK